MAPEPRGTWHHDMSQELFASLFGVAASQKETNAQIEHEKQTNKTKEWKDFPLFHSTSLSVGHKEE